jgi:alkanesulfonate monooxygenase SsuD/methylene tetrahydromethanopterin reductase-like flavin-dependent oxidoreductase (luciferase family)
MAPVTGIRQPHGTAFALRDPLPWASFAGLVRAGESMGYEAVFLPEIAGRDAFAALTGLAGETDHLLLGSGIVPMTSRQARVTAMGAATVQDRSGGRMILGLGTGPVRKGALDTLEGQIEEIRTLLNGNWWDRLSLQSERPVPIWMSALGPRATALAGRVADGVLLNWCTPERVAEARADVSRAAEQSGRDPDEVTVAVYVRASIGGDRPLALTEMKSTLVSYASYPAYARQFQLMGLGAEVGAAVAAARLGDVDAVPDDLVSRMCIIGDAAEGRTRLQAYRDAGADLPVVYPVPTPQYDPAESIRATLEALAPAP